MNVIDSAAASATGFPGVTMAAVRRRRPCVGFPACMRPSAYVAPGSTRVARPAGVTAVRYARKGDSIREAAPGCCSLASWVSWRGLPAGVPRRRGRGTG